MAVFLPLNVNDPIRIELDIYLMYTFLCLKFTIQLPFTVHVTKNI